jgi:hypothetical protein
MVVVIRFGSLRLHFKNLSVVFRLMSLRVFAKGAFTWLMISETLAMVFAGALDVPKMATFGKSDLYCRLNLNRDGETFRSTVQFRIHQFIFVQFTTDLPDWRLSVGTKIL